MTAAPEGTGSWRLPRPHIMTAAWAWTPRYDVWAPLLALQARPPTPMASSPEGLRTLNPFMSLRR